MSLIHVSFDNWTTKGGKKAFTGIYVHYLSRDGLVEEYPVALPQLAGVHTGERIAEVVQETFEAFEIRSEQVGYFVLDNVKSNDTCVQALTAQLELDRDPKQYRLRCFGHILSIATPRQVWSDTDPRKNPHCYTK